MADITLHYERMIQDAMRSVAREALQVAESHGLPGEHHFYIGFKTDSPGVEIPSHLRAQYPEIMTIILQHQFWDLIVDEVEFSIGLAFGGKREHLRVPFAALTSFVDPSVEFGLQFTDTTPAAAPAPVDDETPSEPKDEPKASSDGTTGDGAPGEKVVSLDKFRKK
jgi:hypothetical protein